MEPRISLKPFALKLRAFDLDQTRFIYANEGRRKDESGI
jgi:hypothetical protein